MGPAHLQEAVEALFDEEERNAEPRLFLGPPLEPVHLVGRVRIEIVHGAARPVGPRLLDPREVELTVGDYVSTGVEVQLADL
jgi:hypothetical protein